MDVKTAVEVLERFKAHYSILKYFRWDHLPEPLQAVSRSFGMLAARALLDVGDTKAPAEVAAGLRKLLEAKDCFVRAALK